MADLGLKITRGDATMLYATSHGSYNAILDELKENGIEYAECGTTPVSVADIKNRHS